MLLPWVAVGPAAADGAVEAVAGGDADGDAVPDTGGGADAPVFSLLGAGCAVREPAVGPEPFSLAAGVRPPLPGGVCPMGVPPVR